MKAPRLSVVVANLRNELDILRVVFGLTPEQMEQRINMLTQCIARLEPNGEPAPSAPKSTRTRKPKAAEAEPTL